MVNSRNTAAIFLALATLAGCSVSDHPIPPLDIPGGGSSLGLQPGGNSLAADDAYGMNAAPETQAAYPRGDLSVARNRIPAPTYEDRRTESRNFSGETDGVAFAGSDDVSWDERRGNAAQTLESQAARFAPSRAEIAEPVQTTPIRNAPAPAAAEQQLAAAEQGSARIALAEVSGVGVNAASPLATRFGAQARARGLSFTSAEDKTATHVMKGYFTVGEENGRAVVNYVWDISDRSGKRLHRIQGSEPGGGSGEGWDGVTEAAMQAVADHSIAETASFLGRESG
jgi:hypothetical protein